MRRMMTASLGLGFACALGGGAYADSNNVYIGQTGVTNTITIAQAGLGNAVGANDTTLLLNQDGRNNTVDISQTGWANTVAAVTRFALTTPSFVPANGLNQIGNFNSLTLDQTNTVDIGSNTIEAIYQEASLTFAAPSNVIEVTQTSDGGTGEAEHFIGEIVQINPDTGAAPNQVSVTQSGGGAGIGNSIDRIRQDGDGNIAGITQSAHSNAIGNLSQTGSSNDAVLAQGTGAGNVISDVMQSGSFNQLNISEAGTNNIVETVTQNNDGVAISGNTAKITLAGDDNGGDGLGGVGTFVSVAKDAGVFQATVLQIGDDNDLSYAVSAASHRNLYGFVQDGDGNGIIGNVDGNDNEAAVRETGDDNVASFSQTGNTNAIAVTMDGERNRVFVDQTGERNVVNVAFGSGSAPSSDNNADGLAFTGVVAAVTDAYGLAPGHFHQLGTDNSVALAVTGSGGNMTAAWQEGAGNTITGSVTGSGNQAAVIQAGMDNLAVFSQFGNNNRLIIQQ